MRFDHPEVGRLVLHREKLLITGTDGMMLVIYHPDAASADAEKLALLASAVLPWPVERVSVADRDSQQLGQ